MLTKSIGGKVLVRNPSMRDCAGGIYGFLGPNDSGKTTMLRHDVRPADARSTDGSAVN